MMSMLERYSDDFILLLHLVKAYTTSKVKYIGTSIGMIQFLRNLSFPLIWSCCREGPLLFCRIELLEGNLSITQSGLWGRCPFVTTFV